MEHLYFIAVVPPEDMRDRVTEIKEDFAEKFNSRHALKSPPHITLHMPFKWKEAKRDHLDEKLSEVARRHRTFSIAIRNFNCFEPRVIFLDVDHSSELAGLQKDVRQAMKTLNVFNSNYREKPFHPHMTVAFRDLRKKEFYRAWKIYKEREISFEFPVKAITLLRHTGKRWIMVKDVSLTSN